MDLVPGLAFTTPVPLSASFVERKTMPIRNGRQLLTRFRRRASVSSIPRMTSAANATEEVVRFESFFPDQSTATVLTPENESISLVEHVQTRNAAGETVLIGWLRHFGCTLCKKQAADWLSIETELKDYTNVCMTLIGNGPAQHARDFKDEMKWNGYIFTDPQRQTYKTLDFRSGVGVTFTYPALRKVITSFREGNPQTWKRIPTDPFQQGGAVLVDKNGIVRLFHADAFAGDHFDKNQLVQEIRAAC